MMTTVATAATGKWAGHPIGREKMRGAYWQHVVLSKVELSRNELQKAPPGSWHPAAEALLQQAEDAARRPGSTIRVWLSGSAINRAFVSLHAAQVLMAKHATDDCDRVQLVWAMSRVRTTMPRSCSAWRSI
jgi:hypothetical protein